MGGLTRYDDVESSESPFTWSVAPRFELSPQASIYARAATGFRPGGPNVLPPSAPATVPRSYDSDRLTSYELGLKTGGGASDKFSLDLSAFYLDWEDVQLFLVVNNFGINGNGGAAVSKGLEFAASAFPRSGLVFTLNGSYTDAKLTEDTDPVVGGKDGDPLPSVRSVAAEYQLNPLTVLKGYQQLVDEQLVEKRRGRGMYVTEGARRALMKDERQKFLEDEWPNVLATITRLGLNAEELLARAPAAPASQSAPLPKKENGDERND